jgi:hypothetical protein
MIPPRKSRELYREEYPSEKPLDAPVITGPGY